MPNYKPTYKIVAFTLAVSLFQRMKFSPQCLFADCLAANCWHVIAVHMFSVEADLITLYREIIVDVMYCAKCCQVASVAKPPQSMSISQVFLLSGICFSYFLPNFPNGKSNNASKKKSDCILHELPFNLLFVQLDKI